MEEVHDGWHVSARERQVSQLKQSELDGVHIGDAEWLNLDIVRKTCCLYALNQHSDSEVLVIEHFRQQIKTDGGLLIHHSGAVLSDRSVEKVHGPEPRIIRNTTPLLQPQHPVEALGALK